MVTKKNIPNGWLRISKAAQAAEVSKQTVAYYVMVGLVKPHRPDGRHRFFDEEMIRRIRLIRKLNKTGYTLRDIREIYLRDR